MMKSLTGKCISNQIVIAPLFFVKKAAVGSIIMEETAEDACERLISARKRAVSFCHELIEKAKAEKNREAESIFTAQELLLTDEIFEAAILKGIREKHLSPEMSVVAAGEEMKETLCSSEDEVISAKTADMKDVVSYYLEALGVYETMRYPNIEKTVIVMARELTPAETMRLPKDYVAGFVTQIGSAVSHVSILAQSLDIPALYGVEVSDSYDGKLAILDGEQKILIVDPDEKTLFFYRSLKEKRRISVKKKSEDMLERPWKCYANISGAEEACAAFANGAEGIGLYRSECLFLGRENMPTEEEQFSVYKQILEIAGNREVVIRVLDIGSDKKCPYLMMDNEKNPALGVRGIRYLLSAPEVLRTQLKALYRASEYGNLSILFPMITTLEEVKAAKAFCNELSGNVRIGMMIETPAAALITKEIAAECDFISIGTNDLLQYMMAVDRESDLADSLLTFNHPAVNRILEHIVSAAHAAECEVCICGELAAEELMEPFFRAWKVDVLSMAWKEKRE
ncbi:MAG: phosphoenolpyruvate--protein phosphotransferase [Lachnospiraceae bacterium]|nr:phosphoenolpyruvate--protein phosphotransferase [Lachnospiraceae bacterium]